MIKTIQNWIESWEGFRGLAFPVDALGPGAACGGLFPQGEQVLRRMEDIRGHLRLRKRLTFHLMLTEALDPLGDGVSPGPMDRCRRWVRTPGSSPKGPSPPPKAPKAWHVTG